MHYQIQSKMLISTNYLCCWQPQIGLVSHFHDITLQIQISIYLCTFQGIGEVILTKSTNELIDKNPCKEIAVSMLTTTFFRLLNMNILAKNKLQICPMINGLSFCYQLGLLSQETSNVGSE